MLASGARTIGMRRLLFFLASSTLILACELAYPTHELDDTGARPDAARDAGSCVPSGRYCGNDKVQGDPNTLYLCVADADARVLTRCEAGCVVAPPGTDDYCK
jgi:hypothetical protein